MALSLYKSRKIKYAKNTLKKCHSLSFNDFHSHSKYCDIIYFMHGSGFGGVGGGGSYYLSLDPPLEKFSGSAPVFHMHFALYPVVL